MEARITTVAKLVFYQLCQEGQLITCPDLTTVSHAMVTSRLDYYNLLYARLPLRMSWELQLVQNMAAWVLVGTPITAYIQPVL